MVLHETAYADDELRDGRKRFVTQHVVEDAFELRDDEDEQEGHNDHRERKDDDGVDHRGLHFVFDLLRFFLELGETAENEFEHTAQLARFHHVDEELVKNLRVLLEAFGECAAALHGISHLTDGVFENDVALLFLQHIESTEQRQTSIDQSGELAGKHHQHLGLNRFLLEKDDSFFLRPRSRRGDRFAAALRLLLSRAPLPSS